MTSEVSKKVARTLSRFCIGAVLLMALTIGTIGTAVAKEKVRVGHFTWPGYGFLYVAQEKNLAPDLEFEFTIIEDPIQLHTEAGQELKLAVGNTWVEMMDVPKSVLSISFPEAATE